MTEPLRALSIRQPWGAAIIHSTKRLENRSRVHSYRGPLLIHVSKTMPLDEALSYRALTEARGLPDMNAFASDLHLGGIIGVVDMVGCVRESDDPWFTGPVAFQFENPRPLPFVPCSGTVSPLIWAVPNDVRAKIAL